MKILIVRISAIGDVLHTMPAVKLLRTLLPQATIHWIVQKKAADLLIGQPYIDKITIIPDKPLLYRNWKATYCIMSMLRATTWDAIIDFQGILKTSVFTFALRGKKFGFSLNHARSRLLACFNHYRINPEPAEHVIYKNCALASSVAQILLDDYKQTPTIESLQNLHPLHISLVDMQGVDLWMRKNSIAMPIVLSPSTTWPSKHWPLASWQELVNILVCMQARPIVLLGAYKGEQSAALAQLDLLGLIVAPDWNLQETSAFLKQAAVLVAPDTGILHLADALGLPSVGIFGPTDGQRHGPMLTPCNKKYLVQIACEHRYKKRHEGLDCMGKLKPVKLAEHIVSMLQSINLSPSPTREKCNQHE